jgi:hypothetical protein
MKTPSEILLNRYRAAEPKLDRLRREVIDQEIRSPQIPEHDLPSIVQSPGDWLAVLWQQAIQPWRPAWLGLASAWLLILYLHLGANREGSAPVTRTTRLAPAAMAQLQEQQRLRAELLGAMPTSRPEPVAPRVGPRSEGTRRPSDARQTV